MVEQQYRTCNLCEAMCGLRVTVDGGAGHRRPRRSRRRALARPHLPEGPGAARAARRSGSAARARAAHGAGLGARSAGTRRSPRRPSGFARGRRRSTGATRSASTSATRPCHNHGAVARWRRRCSRALGTKNRFDPNSQDSNPRLFACLQMYGDLASLPVPDVDRTDFFLDPRRQPGRVERQRDDARRRARPAQGHPRARRARRARRSAPHRDGGLGRRAPLHPPRAATRRCSLAMLHVLFAEGLVDDERRRQDGAAGSTRCGRSPRASRPSAWPRAIGIDAGDDPRARARLRRARSARSSTGASASARTSSARWRAGSSRRSTSSRATSIAGRRDVPEARRSTSPASRAASASADAGRWRSRVRGLPELGGHAPRRGDGRGDGDAGRRADPRARLARRQPGALGAERRAPRAGARRARLHGRDRLLPERDDAPRAPHPAAALGARARALRSASSTRSPCATWRSGPSPSLPPEPRHARRLGDPLRARAAPRGEARRPRRGARAPLALRARAARPRAGRSTRCSASGPTATASCPRDGLNLDEAARARRTASTSARSCPMRAASACARATGRVRLAPGGARRRRRRGRALDRREAGAPGSSLIGRRHLRSNNSWMHNLRSLVKGPDRAHAP